MADITVQGYLNDPKEFTSQAGKTYWRFTLAEKQKAGPKDPKAKEDGTKRVYYNCTSFDPQCPENGTYVRITGRFGQRHYTNSEGHVGSSLDVVVNHLEANPERQTARETPASKLEDDPFGDI